MSADLLREAASLIRERAEAAYGSPWSAKGPHVWTARDTDPEEGPTVYVNGGVYANQDHSAEHIASWHPDVALAVADLLDRAADDHDDTPCPAIDAALAVARSYLGSES